MAEVQLDIKFDHENATYHEGERVAGNLVITVCEDLKYKGMISYSLFI